MTTTEATQQANRVPQWTVAHRLEMARDDYAGLTQHELSEATGISRRTISAYEDPKHTGRRNPLYVKAIAEACDVELEWIWTGSLDLRAPDPAPGLGILSSGCIDGPAGTVRHLALAS
jgi:DNA-binding XRE family transcriptional regulator